MFVQFNLYDLQMEAGQYCTFVVHTNGSVWACGKGSYGRLGLGDSATQSLPKRVSFDGVVKKISSSKGSDGHTLAVTEDGRVFSWGDGQYLKNYLNIRPCSGNREMRPSYNFRKFCYCL